MTDGSLLNYLLDQRGKNIKLKTILDFAEQVNNQEFILKEEITNLYMFR